MPSWHSSISARKKKGVGERKVGCRGGKRVIQLENPAFWGGQGCNEEQLPSCHAAFSQRLCILRFKNSIMNAGER